MDRAADDKIIKRAYYRLAQRFHPDKNGCSLKSTIQFQRLSDAYMILRCKTTRDRYNRYLDHQSGIFSKAFWKLLANDKERLGLFIGSTLAVVGGIVGVALSAGVATPAAAIALSCACGGVIGAGSGLLNYDLSLSAALNGLNTKEMISEAIPKFIAGGVAGAIAASLTPFLVQGLNISASAPALNSFTSVTSQYFICQTASVTVEGMIGNRWQGCGINDVAIDLGSSAVIAMTMGSALGMIAGISSIASVTGLINVANTSTDLIIGTMKESSTAEIKTDVSIKHVTFKENNKITKRRRKYATAAPQKLV